MSKAEMYAGHLREEGFNPRIDGDGDVVFKCEGMTCLLTSDEEDTAFFRLLLPSFLEVESDQEERRALRTINAVNARMKVIKLLVAEGSVWASVELFIDPFENFKRVFNRSLRLIGQGIREFREVMQGEEPSDQQ